jgi:hypothetical protein
VYFQRHPNDILNTSSGCTILRIMAIMRSSVLELQGANGCTIRDHSKNYAPYHLLTWILPSSPQLGFLHFTIHVRYVRGQMMLIRCSFVITVMVDTISFASSRSSLKFPPAFGIVHHVLLQHLDFYSNHATLLPAQVWGGIHENFISTSSCALYIYVHASLLVD